MIHDLDTGTALAVVSEDVFFSPIAMREVSHKAVVYAGDYLNKLSGESVERECRQKIADGATELIVDFSRTEIVNSIGVSILLGVIDAAKSNGASVIFKEVNDSTAELFEMLGVTNHVRLIHN